MQKISTIIILIICLIPFESVIAFHPHHGQSCISDADCLEDGWEYCKFDFEFYEDENKIDQNKIINDKIHEDYKQIKKGVCQHKNIFPMKEQEYFGMLLVMAILWITNMGGIGGAGLVIPLSQAFFRFDARNAISLSNISICLSNFIRFYINSKKPHPLKQGKGLLIDLDLSTLMLPMMISGVSFGVIFNIIMPTFVIVLFQASVLFYLGIGVYKKAFRIYQIENEKFQQEKLNLQKETIQKEQEQQILNIKQELIQQFDKNYFETERRVKEKRDEQIELRSLKKQNSNNNSEKKNQNDIIPQQQFFSLKQNQIVTQTQIDQKNSQNEIKDKESNIQAEVQISEQLQDIMNKESTYFQWKKICLHWGIIIVFILINLIKGGNSPQDSLLGLVRCDTVDWYLFIFLQIICVAFFVVGLKMNTSEQNLKQMHGYQLVPGDLEINRSNLLTIFKVGFVGSLSAAFGGIGPAMIYTPALVILGMEAQVATATGGYITVFTTLSSTISAVLSKRIQIDYAVYVLAMTLMGSFPGLFFQQYMVHKYKRVSFQVFIFTASIFLASLSTLAINTPILIHQYQLGTDIFQLQNYCVN